MSNKEECIKALENTRYLNVSIVNETGADIWNGEFEQTKEFDVFEQLIKEHFNPQPYKFEDLKPYMFVFDNGFNGWGEFVTIINTFTNKYGEKLVGCLAPGGDDIQLRSYKEDRFFPVWMANM